MSLSSELVSQLVKATKDTTKPKSESTMSGTTVEFNGEIYVQLDGSDTLTPVSTTTDMKPGERVTVLIKDHTATVTGNITSPSARTNDVKDLGGKVENISNQISEFEIILADKVSTEQLTAEQARIDTLVTENVTIKENLEAHSGTISELQADNVKINESLEVAEADIGKIQTDKIDAKIAEATFATIKSLEATDAKVYNLESTYGEFEQLTTKEFAAVNASIKEITTDKLVAVDASINDLQTNKLSAKDAEVKYANIDFSNIGKATMEYFYAQSGLIKDVVIGDSTITGELVGVTIKGKLIEGGTIVADKLVILGEDGLYYKLNTNGTVSETEQNEYNSLSGDIITANSITASKINVDDLVAFDATIGGFHITENAIFSGTKETADNATRGIYMDNEGQFVAGDASNFLKYYKDADGNYRLAISAQSILLGADQKDIETSMTDLEQNILDVEDRVHVTISEKETSILNTTEAIILSALESYVQTGDYEEFKETVSSQLTVMADEISMNFTTTSSNISDVDGHLQEFITSFSKHISFASDTAITITSGDSEITLELDNDKGIIFRKGEDVFGRWDGENFYTGNIVVEVNERAQFGNFAFVPRSDGGLAFLKVGG